MMKLEKSLKSNGYFQGWYFKQQNKEEAISFIPAIHKLKSGKRLFSLQIITPASSYYLELPIKKFRYNKKGLFIRMGDNYFSKYGCRLKIETSDLKIHGKLWYHSPTPPAYDIMGPFRFVPFMECRHSIYSLHHIVNGNITINGKEITFENDIGYIEGDRGCSFPSRYIWTQCNWEDNSIMISVAEIPFLFGSFKGCIGSLYLNGREYRIATYCGVTLLYISNKKVLLRQGDLIIYVELLDSSEQVLRAPHQGNMKRMIHESVASKVRYRCTYKGRTMLDFITNQGSFESNWNRSHI